MCIYTVVEQFNEWLDGNANLLRATAERKTMVSDQGDGSFGVDVKCALRIQRMRRMKVGMLREHFLKEITLELAFKS